MMIDALKTLGLLILLFGGYVALCYASFYPHIKELEKKNDKENL